MILYMSVFVRAMQLYDKKHKQFWLCWSRSDFEAFWKYFSPTYNNNIQLTKIIPNQVKISREHMMSMYAMYIY